MNLESSFVEKCLSAFGISGSYSAIPGEIDRNYMIISNGGRKAILKISPPDFDKKAMDFQEALLTHLEKSPISSPKMIPAINGEKVIYTTDDSNQERAIRMLTWIEGELWSDIYNISNQLLLTLGEIAGKTTSLLQNFEHPEALRIFDWNLDFADWTAQYIYMLDPEIQVLANNFLLLFKKNKYALAKLRKSVTHNDANDNNIIVDQGSVKSIIDFGDAVYSATINDLAVTVTYAVMKLTDPLSGAEKIVKGYHRTFPLYDEEVTHLHLLVAMRLIVSLTKSAINRQKEPENIYLQVSDRDANNLLIKWGNIHPSIAYFTFRSAIGLTPHPNENKLISMMNKQNIRLDVMFPTEKIFEISSPDMSIGSTFIGHREEFDDAELFWDKIKKWKKKYPNTIPANGYLEVRPFYSTDAYKKEGNQGPEYRTVHLGVDYWVRSGTAVHAPTAGKVQSVFLNQGKKDYGPTVILQHQWDDIIFYTLYGHLSLSSLDILSNGQDVKQGDLIGFIGSPIENGDWAPHLHFQIILDMLQYQNDYPGVAYFQQLDVWKSICPDPNLLFSYKYKTSDIESRLDDMLQLRKQILGKNLSISYRNPLIILRGEGAFLIDHTGRKYLDTVNNVAHVGHEHFRVVNAGRDQLSILNTNTRYLHDNIIQFAELLLTTLPSELCVVYFVNSGSEANELALRMAYTYTNKKDVIALQVGYHGNTNECINVSSYKFEQPGGKGKPNHTHLIPLPDVFRGQYRGQDTAKKYAAHTDQIIHQLTSEGKAPAAFIHESIVSCGGQIVLPDGFLTEVYKKVRDVGGICIADEVQTGLGRIGTHWWAFEQHCVVPDIVTIGKPLGNGHPLAAVVCTKAIADAFANGMEYFNTFGGNPVSCAIGTEVLKIIKEENLMGNAKSTGDYLINGLKSLQSKFPIIGDVRGQGLFLGFELVDQDLKPLPVQTAYLSNRMKDYGILTSTDGPDHNVIKIKPPLCFNNSHADEFLYRLNHILHENHLKL